MSEAMLLSDYEADHPQRAGAPKYDIGEIGACEGDCPSCEGKGVYFHRPTSSPSDCEWRACPDCDGTGRIRLTVDIPGYGGPGALDGRQYNAIPVLNDKPGGE